MGAGYNALIFIPNDEKALAESVNRRLVACLQGANPSRIGLNENIPTRGDSFTGHWQEWSLTVVLSDEPHVARENQEWAEAHAFQPPFDVIGQCKRRVELWTDADPKMDDFNTYLGVLEEMEKQFEGAILMEEEGQM